MRASPVFSDTSDRPSFLRTTPAKKPRTECCCQPVAVMMAAMVAPCRPCSMAITAACFDSARPALAGLRGASPVRLRGAAARPPSPASLALGPRPGLGGARLGTLAGADRREAARGDAQRNRSLIFAPPLRQGALRRD